MQLKAAIGSFFVEFSKFETLSIGMALRAVSRDAVFVEQAERLLDFDARLKLLERMAIARDIPPALAAELEAVMLRARKLREQHDEVAANLNKLDLETGKPVKDPGAIKQRQARRRGPDFPRVSELDDLWMPSMARVGEYAREAIALQESLQAITRKLDQHLAGLNTEPMD